MATVLGIDLKELKLVEGCIEECIPNWIERLRLENEGGVEKVSEIQVEEAQKTIEPTAEKNVDIVEIESVKIVDPVVVAVV